MDLAAILQSKMTGESDLLFMETNLFILEDTERYNAAFGRQFEEFQATPEGGLPKFFFFGYDICSLGGGWIEAWEPSLQVWVSLN